MIIRTLFAVSSFGLLATSFAGCTAIASAGAQAENGDFTEQPDAATNIVDSGITEPELDIVYEESIIPQWEPDPAGLKRICMPGYYYGRFICRFKKDTTCDTHSSDEGAPFQGPISIELIAGGDNGEVITVADGSRLGGRATQVGNMGYDFNAEVTGGLECQSGNFDGELDGLFTPDTGDGLFGSGGLLVNKGTGELAGELGGQYTEIPGSGGDGGTSDSASIQGNELCFAMSNPGSSLAGGDPPIGVCKGTWEITLCELARDTESCQFNEDCCSEICEESICQRPPADASALFEIMFN